MTCRCALTDAAFARTMVPKWGKSELTWFIANALPRVGVDKQRAIIAEAWASWSRVCGLTFKYVTDERQADIVVGCGRGKRANFDGPGNTAAWAQLPSSENFDGQLLLMYDMDEQWDEDSLLGISVHEGGHNLGLSHGPQNCIMSPVYSGDYQTPQKWDIAEAQSRYGKPVQQEPAGDDKPDEVVVRVNGKRYRGLLEPA